MRVGSNPMIDILVGRWNLDIHTLKEDNHMKTEEDFRVTTSPSLPPRTTSNHQML